MSPKHYTAAATAAIAGGVAWLVSGPLQLAGVNEHETKVITFGEHLLISLFSLSLVLTAFGYLALGRHARNDAGAKVAAAGMGVLSLVALSSNINGADLGFFPVAATVTNLMWLGGSIHLAVSLYRTGRVAKWVAIALPFVQVFALPLSAAGGGMIAGAYWIGVGSLMRSRSIEQGGERATVPAAA